MSLNRKIYENIVLKLQPYQLKLNYESQNLLTLHVRNEITGIEKEALLRNQALPTQLLRFFTKVQQIYLFFHKIGKQAKQLEGKCIIDDEKIVIKLLKKENTNESRWQNVFIRLNPTKVELTPYQKLKRGVILQQLNQQLNNFRSSKMLRARTDLSSTLKAPIVQVKPKEEVLSNFRIAHNQQEDWKRDLSKLSSHLDSMNVVLKSNTQEIQTIKEKINVSGLQRVFQGYEARQDSILSKLTKLGEQIIKLRLDKKQTAKKIQQQSSDMWEQIGRIREMIKTTTQYTIREASLQRLNSSLFSDFNRQFEGSIKSRGLRQQTQNSEAISFKDKPIQFTRKEETEHNISLFMPNSSFVLTEEEMEKFKLGVEDQSFYRKKIKELEKKIYSSLPPTKIIPKFQKSKFATEFLISNEKQGTLISKKDNDKKCQLVGEAFPKTGKVYFNVQLLQIPNGYIHVGVVSGDALVQMSSHDNNSCVNYFGGNGSINDKGNGIFIGKQLDIKDVISVLVDVDLKKVLFILRGQVLGEVSVKGLDFSKGLYPYLQLFYGGSKIKI